MGQITISLPQVSIEEVSEIHDLVARLRDPETRQIIEAAVKQNLNVYANQDMYMLYNPPNERSNMFYGSCQPDNRSRYLDEHLDRYLLGYCGKIPALEDVNIDSRMIIHAMPWKQEISESEDDKAFKNHGEEPRYKYMAYRGGYHFFSITPDGSLVRDTFSGAFSIWEDKFNKGRGDYNRIWLRASFDLTDFVFDYRKKEGDYLAVCEDGYIYGKNVKTDYGYRHPIFSSDSDLTHQFVFHERVNITDLCKKSRYSDKLFGDLSLEQDGICPKSIMDLYRRYGKESSFLFEKRDMQPVQMRMKIIVIEHNRKKYTLGIMPSTSSSFLNEHRLVARLNDQYGTGMKIISPAVADHLLAERRKKVDKYTPFMTNAVIAYNGATWTGKNTGYVKGVQDEKLDSEIKDSNNKPYVDWPKRSKIRVCTGKHEGKQGVAIMIPNVTVSDFRIETKEGCLEEVVLDVPEERVECVENFPTHYDVVMDDNATIAFRQIGNYVGPIYRCAPKQKAHLLGQTVVMGPIERKALIVEISDEDLEKFQGKSAWKRVKEYFKT